MDEETEQKEKIEEEIEKLESIQSSLGRRILGVRDTAFTKYPMVFMLLSSFGLVAVFYGFEKVIDSIPFFSQNPYVLLISGVVILIGTGTLYKKLS